MYFDLRPVFGSSSGARRDFLRRSLGRMAISLFPPDMCRFSRMVLVGLIQGRTLSRFYTQAGCLRSNCSIRDKKRRKMIRHKRKKVSNRIGLTPSASNHVKKLRLHESCRGRESCLGRGRWIHCHCDQRHLMPMGFKVLVIPRKTVTLSFR